MRICAIIPVLPERTQAWFGAQSMCNRRWITRSVLCISKYMKSSEIQFLFIPIYFHAMQVIALSNSVVLHLRFLFSFALTNNIKLSQTSLVLKKDINYSTFLRLHALCTLHAATALMRNLTHSAAIPSDCNSSIRPTPRKFVRYSSPGTTQEIASRSACDPESG